MALQVRSLDFPEFCAQATIAGRDVRACVQLRSFTWSGIRFTLNVGASAPLPRYLKTIVVHVVDKAEQAPANALLEVDGWSNDVNGKFGGRYVYLVAEYTTSASEAATGFTVRLAGSALTGHGEDMAKGAGGKFRYLEKRHDVGDRLIEAGDIKLWRTKKKSSKPDKRGYDGWSQDLNVGRGKDYLYICWHKATATAL